VHSLINHVSLSSFYMKIFVDFTVTQLQPKLAFNLCIFFQSLSAGSPGTQITPLFK
jgi:hypothetical protein